MLLVAGVDPLRAVAAEEIAVEHEARDAFEHGHAVFLGGAGIDGALVDNEIARLQHRAHGFGGADQGGQVGPLVHVNRGRHGHDVDVAVRKVGDVSRKAQAGRFGQFLGAHFQRRIAAFS